MKTPDKIKKWLEYCVCIDDLDTCQECPYYGVYPKGTCIYTALKNYVAYVRHLESSNAQVKKALSDNGFASLEAFLQSYNQVKAERDALFEILEEEWRGVCAENGGTNNV